MIKNAIQLSADRLSGRKAGHPDQPSAQIFQELFTGDSKMTDSSQTKRCTKCKAEKLLSEFCKDKSRLGGHNCYCKSCCSKLAAEYQKGKGREISSARSRRYRQTERGARLYKASNKAYRNRDKGREYCRKSAKKYRTRWPQKAKARNAVSSEVRAGRIPPAKTLPCKQCDANAELYHHHKGYEKNHWLDVIPLCHKCDRQAHKLESLNRKRRRTK